MSAAPGSIGSCSLLLQTRAADEDSRVAAGKSTLLKALAGKLRKDPFLKTQGEILYNGEGFDSFYPERTAAYVDQVRASLHFVFPLFVLSTVSAGSSGSLKLCASQHIWPCKGLLHHLLSFFCKLPCLLR